VVRCRFPIKYPRKIRSPIAIKPNGTPIPIPTFADELSLPSHAVCDRYAGKVLVEVRLNDVVRLLILVVGACVILEVGNNAILVRSAGGKCRERVLLAARLDVSLLISRLSMSCKLMPRRSRMTRLGSTWIPFHGSVKPQGLLVCIIEPVSACRKGLTFANFVNPPHCLASIVVIAS
jgi:hypothetical protein